MGKVVNLEKFKMDKMDECINKGMDSIIEMSEQRVDFLIELLENFRDSIEYTSLEYQETTDEPLDQIQLILYNLNIGAMKDELEDESLEEETREILANAIKEYEQIKDDFEKEVINEIESND